jgi:hypothetical protein
MIHLLVPYYQDPDAGRASELAECLEFNGGNAHLDTVHVLLEGRCRGGAHFQGSKLELFPLGRRVLYLDLFQYAAEHVPAGVWVVAANADIALDHSIGRLRDLDGDKAAALFICLTRYEPGPVLFWQAEHSQDTWAWVNPMPCWIGNHLLGPLGSENRLARQAHEAGMTLFNPSLTIRTLHVHKSAVRRRGTGGVPCRYKGDYAFPVPQAIEQTPQPPRLYHWPEDRNE